MAAAVKFFKTIRNNWKKSVLFSGLALYGVDYGKKAYEDSVVRRLYCLEAKKYGDMPLRTGENAKRVTVFLNPAAKGGRAKKLFDKNVAPILYLAGFEVTVIKTEYEGQAKKYMDVLDDTDVIVVAGGDGTLLEVVTGLMRRADHEQASKVPLGVVPLGQTNTMAKSLYIKGTSDARWLMESAMSVVLGRTQPEDVLALKGDRGSVFALSDMRWGAFREAAANTDKYWYFPGLKYRYTYVRAAMASHWPPKYTALFRYSLPCDGCSKCYMAPPPKVWKWWHFLLPPAREAPTKDYSSVINEDCGVEHEADFTATDFVCSSRNNTGTKDGKALMDVYITDETPARVDFIKEGWRRMKCEAQEILPRKHLAVNKFKLHPEVDEDKENWFTVDSEQYEVMSVEVELLKDKLTFFCSGDTPAVQAPVTS